MKKKNLLLVICACIISLSLCACSDESEEINSESVENIESVVEATDEVTTKNTAETVEETESVEVVNIAAGDTEKMETTQEAESEPEVVKWINGLQLEKPAIVIWNEQTLENSVLEDKQEYQIKEGDRILLVLEGRMDTFQCEPMSAFEGFESYKQLYLDMTLNIAGSQEMSFTFDTDGEMHTLTNTFVKVPEQQFDMVDWETWATSTETEDVRLAVWNEYTGTQVLLENQAKHVIQPGDRFSIAYREEIRFVNTSYGEVFPIECSTGKYYELPTEDNSIAVMIKNENEEYLLQFVTCWKH